MSGTWLVIPSCRMDSLRLFFQEWGAKGGWDRVVIVEDAPQKSDLPWLKKDCLHVSHREIAETLGDAAWIVSKRDSAIRCFGFLLAWWGGAERVLTLDDDVRPVGINGNPLVAEHRAAMVHRRWLSSMFGLRVRGIPYETTGELPDVVANVGLWTRHMDFDAVQQLSLMSRESDPSYSMPNNNWIVPHGQFAPVCGMNLMLDRKALPLAYFPLMGAGQPFARFDDIWMGVTLKHCCDALGWHVSVGKPFVDHQKASDPFVNLRKESPGIGTNETFWQRIAEIDLSEAEDALDCMARVGKAIQGWPPEEHDGYWLRLGVAVQRWVQAFRVKPKGLVL